MPGGRPFDKLRTWRGWTVRTRSLRRLRCRRSCRSSFLTEPQPEGKMSDIVDHLRPSARREPCPMSDLFLDSSAAWAALIIVVLPLLIIGSGEVEERLRQRDSPYQPAIGTLRIWVVPLLTVWVLARALLDVADDNLFIQTSGQRRSACICGCGPVCVPRRRHRIGRSTPAHRPTTDPATPAGPAAASADHRDRMAAHRWCLGSRSLRLTHRARGDLAGRSLWPCRTR